MRVLALVGLLLVTSACGLGVEGLGIDLGDDGGSEDAASSEDATAIPDVGVEGAAEGAPGALADAAANDGDASRGSLESGPDVLGMQPDGGAVDSAPGDGGGPADSGAGEADAGGSPVDGAGDGSEGGGSSAMEAGSPCLAALPIGWTVAAYGVGPSSCPAAFTEHDVLGTPSVGANACSCNCTVTADGSCTQGTLTVYGNHDTTSFCSELVLPATQISSSHCLSAGGASTMTASHGQATPLPPQGGSCSSTSMSDPTQVSTPPARYCDVAPASAESLCGGAAPTGFAACVMTAGEVACPANTPFVNGRYVVEDSVSLACSSCSCSVNTTCSNARLSAFGDVNCLTPPVASIALDGACNYSGAPPPPAPPTNTMGIEYTATATTTCSAGTSTGGTTLTNPRTLCCR